MAGDQGQGRGVRDVPLVLVAAVARNGIIGANGGLPWRLSSDLKRFKALTWGKPLVTGRKTFESIGRALPGRETIVVTRDPTFAPSGVLVAHNLEAALDLAAERACAMGADEIIIGGGGEIYAQTIARAHRLFITEVALDAEGEARFPTIDPRTWLRPAGRWASAARATTPTLHLSVMHGGDEFSCGVFPAPNSPVGLNSFTLTDNSSQSARRPPHA